MDSTKLKIERLRVRLQFAKYSGNGAEVQRLLRMIRELEEQISA